MSTVFKKLANPSLDDVVPYVPGPTREEVSRRLGLESSRIIKLSSNENPLGVPPKAMEAMQHALPNAHEYPPSSVPNLQHKLAGFIGVGPDNIVCGTGSSELQAIIIKVFTRPGDEVLSFTPSFSWYSEAAQADGRKPVVVPLDANFDVDLGATEPYMSSRTRLVFLPRPNNPTSRVAPLSVLTALSQRLPEAVIVSDEAYIEFAPDWRRESAVGLVEAGASVLVTRTFSKAFGLAGLRIGYVVGAPEAISALARAKPKWNVGTVAEAAAIAALGDREHLERTLAVTSQGRAYLYKVLPELGLPVVAGAGGNFVMVDARPSGMTAQGMAEALLSEGIMIRGDFSPDYLRISIGRPEENEQMMAAIRRLLAAR